AAGDDIVLRFNDLWMQYGGRFYTPWAASEGGTDLTYCLGTENSASGYALGLRYAREKKSILGAPATVLVPPGESRILRYGTLFAPYEGPALDGGIVSAEAVNGALSLAGKNGAVKFAADPAFSILKEAEAKAV
ncbi:MAG: hypothetical protein FWH38_06195, partial [Treponema sp.]|nr:hypothetical protein [Treponema sp.]